jgi:F0F1-type ATP synthase assembly protein I
MSKSIKRILRQSKIRERISSIKFRASFIGILIGGLAGFLYYQFVGCTKGSCPITSHPFNSVLVGGLMGYLVSGIVTGN